VLMMGKLAICSWVCTTRPMLISGGTEVSRSSLQARSAAVATKRGIEARPEASRGRLVTHQGFPPMWYSSC